MQAQSEQRQLLMYFTSRSCSKCKTIDTYMDRDEVRNALDEKFVIVQVDIEDYDGQACRDIYQIRSVPALVVVESDGTIAYKSQGELSTGDLESIVTNGELPPFDPEEDVSISTEQPANDINRSEETYAIQIGFFSSQDNAEKLRQKALSEGYKIATVRNEIRDGKTFYRVLVGDYEGTDIAQADLNSLKNSGFSVKMHKYRP